jgi:hypothetical protein
MPNHTPYLQRRGDTFSFRIAVPSHLLSLIGKREFTKSLQTTDKHLLSQWRYSLRQRQSGSFMA